MRILTAIIIFQLFLVPDFNATGQTPLKFRDTTIQGPQTFAIVMGVSKYKFIRPLAYADKDAEMFRDYLKSPGGGSVKNENIFCLLNEKANSSNFWGKGFQWLKAKNLQKGDRLFIYLAGHGDAIDEDQFFYLGYDCNPEGDKNNYLVAGTIQLYNLKKKIAAETTKGVEVFFIMDACRSNELPGGKAGQNFLNNAISEKRVGEIIMLATGAGQESLEDVTIGNGHGLFTYYLVDGLTGSAENSTAPDNKISYQEIQNYVNKNVPSVAQQQFKRRQEPYFCCNENTDRIISTIDTAYFNRWLKIKIQQTKGPGNAVPLSNFSRNINRPNYNSTVDTTLLQTYELFNKAINDKNFTGKLSAEYFYETLNTKYAGNPYTLDAKSTLAVEFINIAQDKVNQYLGCQTNQSAQQKQEFYNTGLQLEKAINIIREYDTDYAMALMGRMYLLKASGDFGNGGTNGDRSIAFQHAHAALAIDPSGAYIQNKLALLHLENKNIDSALYYANKASNTAPNWVCALTTLALVKQATQQINPDKSIKSGNKKTIKKNSFGVVAGSGISQLKPTYKEAGNTNIIGINPKNIIKLDLGIFYQLGISKRFSIRPSTLISMEGGELVYQRRGATGTQIILDPVKLNTTSVTLAVPMIIRFSNRNSTPYILLGTSYSYLLSQDATSSKIIPLKKSILSGDAGIGIDIGLAKTKLMLSPELKFSQGVNNIRPVTNNEYSNTLSSLKKQGFTISVYLRGK